MLARVRWFGLTVVVSLGLAAPAEAQLWKPKKKPAATAARPTKAKPAPTKASASERPARKAKKKPTRRARAAPRFDDDPIIVIEDP